MQTPPKPHSKKYKGFTLVELIVVITILVILSTIAFLNLWGFQSSARDANRIENLTNLKKWLDIFQIKSGKYPLPENPITLTASWPTNIIGYQWFAKEQIGSIANLSSNGTLDPLDSTIYTTYSINVDRTKMQLMSFLEDSNNVTAMNSISQPSSLALLPKGEGNNSAFSLLSLPLGESWTPQRAVLWRGEGYLLTQASASSTSDYSKRYPRVIWDSLGILLGNSGGSLNQPVQELYVANSFTGVDVVNTNSGYLAVFGNKGSDRVSGSGITLLYSFDFLINPIRSCQNILKNNNSKWDGIYTVNPVGTGSFQVYCDMTTDGGGWTIIFN